MVAVPAPSIEENRANSVFDALLWSLSRPGLKRALPGEGEALIVEALIDRECSVFCADTFLIPLVLRTGAHIVELPQADHAFLGSVKSADVLRELNRGSDLYPDDGATAIVQVSFGLGQRLRFSGPGVEVPLELELAGLPNGFWETRTQIMRYPMGFDLFLLDGPDIVGVPRSTIVEVI
ncbi:MAG: phosphonate C-P lyase system protein PhnH [Pseudomonadota bacterium]